MLPSFICWYVSIFISRWETITCHMWSGQLIFKVELLPKSNRGFICDCIRVKLSCKSIITTKEALLRFTVVSFSDKLIFSGVQGHSDAGIKISIFFKKTKKARHNMKLCSSYHQVLNTWTPPSRQTKSVGSAPEVLLLKWVVQKASF